MERLESREVPAGVPTAAEQVFLERLNDARANPAAYGASIGLDLSGVAPTQPLAFDPRLVAAAQGHSADMAANGFFDHTGSNGSDPGQRMQAAGYPTVGWAESIAAGYPTSESALAGLIIDQGVPDLGHRRQLLSIDVAMKTHEHVGIGVLQNVAGFYHSFYTVDTAFEADPRVALTGVVYNDGNGNGRFDAGEGLGGAWVGIVGVALVTTWPTGGYSLPVGAGTWTVTFSGPGLNTPVNRVVTVGSQNVRLNVTPPVSLGPLARVLDGSVPVEPDTGVVSFGSTAPGAAVSRTLTVRNAGDQPLTLGEPSLPAGFTLTSPFGTSSVPAGGTTTFTLRFDALVAGVTTGTVSFATSDPARDPYEFRITGTVDNTTPAPDAGPAAALDEGSSFTRAGSFTDPDAGDSWTATVDYGDGGGAVPLALDSAARTFALSHVYPRFGSYTATVKVTDDAGATGTATVAVTVANVAPTVAAGPDASVAENSPFTRTAAITDPGAGPWTATVDYGDGGGLQPVDIPAGARTVALSHSYADNGDYTVTVTVTDDAGASASDTVTVTVTNVPPAVNPPATQAVAASRPAWIRMGTLVDPGAADGPWQVRVAWGDGAEESFTVTTTGLLPARSHTYTQAGSHTVTVTVTDKDGDQGQAAFAVVPRTALDLNGDGRDDLAGRTAGGQWWAAVSGATGSANRLWGAWNEAAGWRDVTAGDFNGDGKADLAGRTAGGQWWVALAGAASADNRLWGQWNEAAAWRDVRAGDFNGDGRADLAGRTAGGQWWVAVAGASGFSNQLWGGWNEAAAWRDVRTGDFNGDGRADLAGRTAGGQWWVALGGSSGFANQLWGQWNEAAGWRDVIAADFNGDGRDDLAGRTAGGQWWVAVAGTVGSANQLWTQWNEAAGWRDVTVGDFNGDGKADLAGRTAGGDWWVAVAGTSGAANQYKTHWNEAAAWRDVTVGDFDGDGKDDLAGRTAGGDWWVSLGAEGAFTTRLWGSWNEAAGWHDVLPRRR